MIGEWEGVKNRGLELIKSEFRFCFSIQRPPFWLIICTSIFLIDKIKWKLYTVKRKGNRWLGNGSMGKVLAV